MDFLNKLSAQLRDLFLSMTPGARITTVLLFAVVVVSIVYLFQFQAGGPNTYLMGGEPFSADQLSVMEAAFGKAGLSDHERDGNRIRIPRGQTTAYMAALSDAEALPPSFFTYLDKALAGEGIFESKRTREERLKLAKQKELALIIRTMPGVTNASVLYDQKEIGGLRPQAVATASVSVQPDGSAALDPRRVRAIKKLVAGAFAGLQSGDVTVADLNGPVYAAGGDDGVGDGTDDAYFNLTALYEKKLQQDIQNQLSYIPGVRVTVSAELDKEVRREEKQVVIEPKNIAPIQSHLRTENSSDEAAAPGGRPGLAAQQPGGPSSGPASVAQSRASMSQEKNREEETQNAIPHQQIMTQFKGLTPQRVRASIVVPSSYYRAIWQEKNKPADGAEPPEPSTEDLQAIETLEKKNIQSAVAPLLATVSDRVDPLPQVTVTTFFHSPTADPLPTPSRADQVVAWLGDSWGTLTTAALAFFSLLMLRSMIRSTPTPEAGTTEVLPNLSVVSEPEETAPAGPDESPRRGKRRFVKGPSYKDDLAEMVREDPEAAATILRAWIASAG